MIKSTNIILRELKIKDLDDYLYWNHPSREFHKFNGPYYGKETEEELRKYIEDLRTLLINGEKNVFKNKKIIANKDTDEIIGQVNWYWKSQETLWMEVGIIIFNEDYWGNGIGYTALKMWIDEIFAENPKLIRVGLSTWSGNKRMMKLSEKLGLTKEAVYRKARIVDNQYYDSVSYGVLKEEWQIYMKKVNLNHIASWIHKNARELEITIWKYHFEGGNKEDVVNALMYYQNKDGGFGNAVDPDNWNVNSLPYATLFVINILNYIEFYDMQHPIYIGIKRYIDTESNFPEGWTFTVATNKDCPHASYYNYDDNYNKTESTGIILGFCSFIIEHYHDSKIYSAVLELVDKLLKKLYSDNLGDMGPTGYIMLVNAMKHAQIDGYDYDKLELRLKELVNNSIQRNPEQWAYYGYRPSDYIKSKDSIFYQDNKDIVNVELDFLHDTLPENDVWPISWSWFNNSEKYPKESVISGNWCKSIKAIERAKFLKNFIRTQ